MTQLEYSVDGNGKITFTGGLPTGLNLSQEISGIKVIPNGAVAESKPLNDNFAYLNTKITTAKSDMAAQEAVFVSEVNTTINNALSVYQDVNVISAASGDINLACDNIYRITPADNVNLKLPTEVDNTKFNQIYVQLNLGTYYNVSLGTTWGFDDIAPFITQAGMYNIMYEHDGSNWVCGFKKRSEVD